MAITEQELRNRKPAEPVARRLQVSIAAAQINAGLFDQPRMELFERHQKVLTQIEEHGPSEATDASISTVQTEGQALYGLNFDKLSRRYAKQRAVHAENEIVPSTD